MNGEQILLDIIKNEPSREMIKKYLLYIEDNYLGYLIRTYCSLRFRNREQGRKDIIDFFALVSDYSLKDKEADEYLLSVLTLKLNQLPESIAAVVIKYFICKQYHRYEWIDFRKHLGALEQICAENKLYITELIKLSKYNPYQIKEIRDDPGKYKNLYELLYP